jgi:two-component system sensor histidine kinase AlgZ
MDTTAIPSTSMQDTGPPPSRSTAMPELCESGVILRSLLFVQVVAGVAAGFGSVDWTAWFLRTAVAAAVAVPATLGWLVAACSATPLLARLPAPARMASVAAAGGLAAWAACMPLQVLGMGVYSASSQPAIVSAGAIMGAVIYHWLVLRQRATLPAATEARLVELQARVRPHFLFNTLNTAIALIRVDPARAEAVMEDLSELFRAALGALEGESTLGDEIRLARLYLDIEGMRFGKRLSVEWDIDEGVNAARVPPLVLQPLVENAVRHGVEPSPEGGRVQIRARVRNGRAWVQVINTVRGPTRPGHGIGLASARERLRLMHDLHADFQSGMNSEGRFRVRLAVPLA